MIENIKTEKTFAELNKVAGFDPLKFARKVIREGAERVHLDLKYKKLWFRLKYPQGKIKVSPLKITDQFAIIEAKVFFDKNDAEPVSSYIAQRYAKDIPSRLYIESAHQTAVDQALSDAGFGLQLLSVQSNAAEQIVRQKPPISAVSEVPKSTEAVVLVQETGRQEQNGKTIVAEIPLPEEKVIQEKPPVIHEIKAVQPVVEEQLTDTASISKEPVSDMTVIPLTEEKIVPEEPPVIHEIKAVQPVVEEKVTDAASINEEPVNDEAAAESLPYTMDMSVEDICSKMTLKEAGGVIVDVGTCTGWPLQQVLERRPQVLKWYIKGYFGDNNILRAGATLLLNSLNVDKAG